MTALPRATFRARGLRLALLALLVLTARAAAQGGTTLNGVVVDSGGKPVSSQRLTLHRVNATGGALVDSATTDAQGRFSFRIPAETDTSAVFFAATRWQGQLYIGQPFKPPVPAGETYTVTVGVNPVQMGPATGAGAPPGMPGAEQQPTAPVRDDSGNGRWFLVTVLALVAVGAIGYALLASRRDPGGQRRREILAQIADLDERSATASGAQAAALQRERAELLAQLRGD